MKPELHVDTREFSRAALDLQVATGRSAARVLQDQARLLTRDLLRATPPFLARGGSKGTFTQSWSVQRKTGEARVARDIHRVFRTRDDHAERIHDPKIRAAFLRADSRGVEAILRNIGQERPVLARPDRAIHDAARVQGRVPKSGVRAAILMNAASLTRYIRQRQQAVGKAKSGWMAAARGLAVAGLPAWITRHSAPGAFLPVLTGPRLSITVANLIPYSPHWGLDIVSPAIQNRVRSMATEIRSIAAYNARKARAA